LVSLLSKLGLVAIGESRCSDRLLRGSIEMANRRLDPEPLLDTPIGGRYRGTMKREPHTATSLMIEVSKDLVVSGLLLVPDRPTVCVVVAHGTGAGMTRGLGPRLRLCFTIAGLPLCGISSITWRRVRVDRIYYQLRKLRFVQLRPKRSGVCQRCRCGHPRERGNK
jgi:hypothetical protein